MKNNILDRTQFQEAHICPICHENNSKLIDSIRTINPNSTERLNLRECPVCAHWWIDPMPKQEYLNRLYSESSGFVVEKGYQGTKMVSELDHKNLQMYVARIMELLPIKETYTFLEIGVGSGHLFNYFKNKNYVCYGVEPGCWKPNNPFIFPDIKDVPKNIKFDIIVKRKVCQSNLDFFKRSGIVEFKPVILFTYTNYIFINIFMFFNIEY